MVAPRREHSRKPDETHDRIAALVDGPYLELFGRQSRTGWTVWGNESDKFDDKVAA
jgi:N6-adenosine-specific RNA methylase IME4